MIYAMTIYMEIPSNRYVSRYEGHLQFEQKMHFSLARFEKSSYLCSGFENRHVFAPSMEINKWKHKR